MFHPCHMLTAFRLASLLLDLRKEGIIWMDAFWGSSSWIERFVILFSAGDGHRPACQWPTQAPIWWSAAAGEAARQVKNKLTADRSMSYWTRKYFLTLVWLFCVGALFLNLKKMERDSWWLGTAAQLRWWWWWLDHKYGRAYHALCLAPKFLDSICVWW